MSICSRCYAISEKECIELYNELIQNQIDWHNEEIKNLTSYMI